MTEETKFTVFADDGYANNQCGEGWLGLSLPDLIDKYARKFRVKPVAWAPEWTDLYGGAKTHYELRAESIAAGRLIDYVDGRYVARGVEDKPTTIAPDTKCHCGYGYGAHWNGWYCPAGGQFEVAEPSLAPLPTIKVRKPTQYVMRADPNAAMIARDGPAKPKSYAPFTPFARFDEPPKSTAHPALSSLSLSADLAPSSHQVLPGFGSAAILKTR